MKRPPSPTAPDPRKEKDTGHNDEAEVKDQGTVNSPGMVENKGVKKRRVIQDEDARKVESLGWLTESAMPRKRESRSIELVDGNSSAVQLKAAMLQAQAEATLHRDDPSYVLRKQRRGDIFRLKNAGVDERNRQEESSRSNEHLNAKARLYEKMKRGELNHANSLVDFEEKGFQQAELRSSTMEDEMERRQWEREALREIRSGVALSKLRKDRPSNGVKQRYDNTLSMEEKAVLSQVSAETVRARSKVESIVDKRKASLLARKQKLLAARNRKKKSAASLFASKRQQTSTINPTSAASATTTANTAATMMEGGVAKTSSSSQLASNTAAAPQQIASSSSSSSSSSASVRKGRDGVVLTAYEYRPPSSEISSLPESRPNPHRQYAAIAPPSSLMATIQRAKDKAARPKRRATRFGSDSTAATNSCSSSSSSSINKWHASQQRASDFLASVLGGAGRGARYVAPPSAYNAAGAYPPVPLPNMMPPPPYHGFGFPPPPLHGVTPTSSYPQTGQQPQHQSPM
eukprot:jgi/Bigna1/127791/aug1.5_g2499